jgi:8-oxo-dGTP diphosphatase
MDMVNSRRDFKMSDRPAQIEVMARGVCIRDRHLLVCHTRGAQNTYLPGGHVEFQESAPDALVREIREELGVPSRVRGFLGVIEHTYLQKKRIHCEVNLVFALDLKMAADASPVSCEGHLDFRWIPLNRLGRGDLEPAPLRKRLALWVRDGVIPARWGSTLGG